MPSGVITDGLGFMYNGCMAVFDPRPGKGRVHRAGQGPLQFSLPTRSYSATAGLM